MHFSKKQTTENKSKKLENIRKTTQVNFKNFEVKDQEKPNLNWNTSKNLNLNENVNVNIDSLQKETPIEQNNSNNFSLKKSKRMKSVNFPAEKSKKFLTSDNNLITPSVNEEISRSSNVDNDFLRNNNNIFTDHLANELNQNNSSFLSFDFNNEIPQNFSDRSIPVKIKVINN